MILYTFIIYNTSFEIYIMNHRDQDDLLLSLYCETTPLLIDHSAGKTTLPSDFYLAAEELAGIFREMNKINLLSPDVRTLHKIYAYSKKVSEEMLGHKCCQN